MQPQPPMQFGSGSPLLGGSSPLAQVMAQMQGGQAGATQMTTPSSPSFDPATQQQMAGSTASMPPAQGGQPMPQDPSQGLPPQSNEAQVILDALNTRLKSLSKQDEMKTKSQFPDPQAPPPMMQGGMA